MKNDKIIYSTPLPHEPAITSTPTKTWREEFREYFDKVLKPKKPTMKNLDRELCVNFIEKVEREARGEIIEMLENSKAEHRKSYGHGEYEYIDGAVDELSQAIESIQELNK